MLIHALLDGAGRLAAVAASGVGGLSVPTIVGYTMLVRLGIRGERLRTRLGSDLNDVLAREHAWRLARDGLRTPTRLRLRDVLRGRPRTPLLDVLRTFCSTDAGRPRLDDVQAEASLCVRERFGREAERLEEVAAAAPVWGTLWTLGGLSVGALTLGLGGGLADLLMSFSVAVGTSLIGHTAGHRARETARRLDVYEESIALEAHREIRRYFELPAVEPGADTVRDHPSSTRLLAGSNGGRDGACQPPIVPLAEVDRGGVT